MHFIVSCFGAGAVPSSKAKTWPFGTALMTPYELLDHVEVMLGLGYPPSSEAERIAQYQTKLSSVAGEPFWARSFEADPWATARELLSWRDQLVEAGWSPHNLKPGPARLRDLAAAELDGRAPDAGIIRPLGGSSGCT